MLLNIVFSCHHLVDEVDNLNAANGLDADALTSSLAPGLVVPIPTFCDASILIASILFDPIDNSSEPPNVPIKVVGFTPEPFLITKEPLLPVLDQNLPNTALSVSGPLTSSIAFVVAATPIPTLPAKVERLPSNTIGPLVKVFEVPEPSHLVTDCPVPNPSNTDELSIFSH